MNPGRYARTVRHLTAAQLAHRVRLRTQRALLARYPGAGAHLLAGRPATPELAGWPAGYVPFDARVPPAADLADGRVTLLGATRPLDWADPAAPRLWRYHLHYWDWAWALPPAALPALYRDWRRHDVLGRGDAWSPYVASLRAWSFCGLYARLGATRGLRADLARHEAFLRAHTERDVGGNHLLKNLKALVGLAVFRGDTRAGERRLDALLREVAVQVLADGGHYERAPAYHCQVLADVDDVARLLAAAGTAVPPALTAAVAAMRRWLAAVLLPDGSVPLLNDGYPVPPDAVADLLGTAGWATGAGGSALLPDSGLAVLRSPRLHVLADVGPPCPRRLPAHAHADSLGFVLYVDGRPVVVDPGTSTYAPGPRRAYERSTAAHATVTVDGADSTEVWGAFRAGRRAATTVREAALDGSDGPRLTAEHDGYAWLPGAPVHRRTWRLAGDRLVVEDTVTGTGRHRLEVVLPLAPGLLAQGHGRRLRVHTDIATVSAEVHGPDGRWHVRPAEVAAGWGRTEPAMVAAYQVECVLPVRLVTELGPAPRRARRPAAARQAVPTPVQSLTVSDPLP